MTAINKKNIILISMDSLLFVTIILLLFGSHGFKRDSPTEKNVDYIETMEMSFDGSSWEEISLPHHFNNLKPGTFISLRTTIRPNADDGVYIRSNYAHADIYFDNRHVFTFGKQENYPKYMMTPATEIHVVETYGTGEEMLLRIDYLSPATESVFTIDQPMVGTSKELILERFVHYGLSWIFSLVQIVGGISLILISICLLLIDSKGTLFFWLGLFSLSTGLWFFGTNNFTVTIFPDTTWIYITSFISFGFCMLPLFHFIRKVAEFNIKAPLFYIEVFLGISVMVVIVLQVMKIIPLHRSWNFFRFTTPIVLLFMSILILIERIKLKNKYARRFITPIIILSVGTVVETVNRLIFKPKFIFSFFQIGVLLFLLNMGIIAGMSLKDSINLKKREQELVYKNKLLEIQTEEQRERSLLLVKNEAMISRQRHDLRHHLAVIMELSQDNEELQAYLLTLMEKIPTAKERFCENDVVNAIISHYASLCKMNAITFTSYLIIPNAREQSTNTDLCVIFSNLLENAVEACTRMTENEKFITLKSSLQGNMLIITMDNSFNGEVNQIGDRFCSAKRNDYGIGLASIQSISRQARGDARFHADGKVFYSSVYLNIKS